MSDNVTSIRVYRKWWHGLLRRPTDLHFVHSNNTLMMFDVKGKYWLPQRLTQTDSHLTGEENATK